ncbi:MAG: DUF2149 domain-containing protein [Clostridiales Family XIII bacterium]|jgi:hypothetical protein|nr:DUF2149 domain-containing protein [Clostridiales Family XIII bacterium]
MLGSNLKRRRSLFEQEDVNPMDGAINIVDAMLVFACGLMLSLVIYWNIDIQHTELVAADAGQEVTSIADDTQAMEDIDKNAEYEKMGTVYVDPVTGKMYLVEDGVADNAGGADNAANAGGSAAEVSDE